MHYCDDSFKPFPEAPQLLHVLFGLGMELDHLFPTAHTSVLIVGSHCGVDARLEGQQLKNYIREKRTCTRAILLNAWCSQLEPCPSSPNI